MDSHKTIGDLEATVKEVEESAAKAKSLEDVAKVKKCLDEGRHILREGSEWWAQFDVKRGQEMIDHIAHVIDEAKLRVRPRRRFKFKSTTSSTTKTTTISKDNENCSNVELDIKTGIDIDMVDIQIEKDKKITVNMDNVAGKSVRVRNGSNGEVMIPKGAKSVWILDLVKCVVDITQVDGPVWIRDCKQCVIRCSCRQLRIHGCARCLIRTNVVGAPILEMCSEMRIGPLRGSNNEGRWKDVVDMSWLHEGGSKNWRFVQEDELDEDVIGNKGLSTNI